MEALDPTKLPRRVLAGARCILAAPSGVVRLDADHYRVMGTRADAASVRVYRRGAAWRCSNDRRHHAAQPCAHILAVLETVGAVRLPVTVSAQAARREALEAEAARLLPERLPVLLGRMLDASAAPPPPGRGRPKCSPSAMLHQGVLRAIERRSLRSAPGVGRATMRRFLADAGTEDLTRGLLEWTLAHARPQDATRPDACNRAVLPFTTPTGAVVMEASWTPSYGLLARLEPVAGTVAESPGGEAAASRFASLVGLDLASHDATAQRNEARLAAIAYNLARLVVVDLERVH